MIFQSVITFAIILCILIATLSYYSKLDFVLKLVTLPFSVFFIATFIYWTVNNIGTPQHGYPKEEFKYIHHTMKGNETIYLWIYEEKFEDHRLYEFPYDREIAKKLTEAKSDIQKGIEVSGKVKANPKGSRTEFRLELERTAPNSGVGPVKK